MQVANEIATPEKRSMFLERVSAMLLLRRPFDDGDVARVAELAATGLARRPAA
jgi:hypothetical protein